MIALQKPVRPATGGEPAGAPLFTLRGFSYDKDFFELWLTDRKIKERKKSADWW